AHGRMHDTMDVRIAALDALDGRGQLLQIACVCLDVFRLGAELRQRGYLLSDDIVELATTDPDHLRLIVLDRLPSPDLPASPPTADAPIPAVSTIRCFSVRQIPDRNEFLAEPLPSPERLARTTRRSRQQLQVEGSVFGQHFEIQHPDVPRRIRFREATDKSQQ